MQRITACGLNAVRLPLGHWVLQESGEAYEGPCRAPKMMCLHF